MEWRVSQVRYLDGFRLLLTFQQGKKKVIDLANHLNGEVFEPLRDVSYFRTVKVDPELDTITWDNGADFAPEFLFEHSSDWAGDPASHK
jgi:hypothetical protein